jgi:hypothetical protein
MILLKETDRGAVKSVRRFLERDVSDRDAAQGQRRQGRI